MPTWDELARIKAWVIGDHYAYQVLPPAAFYVNQRETVLHLFAPVDGRPRLPEFFGPAARWEPHAMSQVAPISLGNQP